ncbi:hypothetical protein M9194_04635 [Vibrio sp. S4M6]|uniref:hypothetical protein n=1 Tax=Vibrio sinus TaxID=2946865 RepID=UPI00202A27A9|nr:hypothetical protein [Vibrio sinus]MCL9780723.1 hypothetical protein [Vibrio sinus]
MFSTMGMLPVSAGNSFIDGMFYDISNLNFAEYSLLTTHINIEGSILVVKPEAPGMQVYKYNSLEEFRAIKGPKIEHFVIAGASSSDVGAASLGRTLANHLGEAVGVIISCFGVSDLPMEALQSWFFFGGIQRYINEESLPSSVNAFWKQAKDEHVSSAGTQLLIDLLREEGRTIRTLLGHSKGCLSLVHALSNVKHSWDVSNINLITVGAIVPFPTGMKNVKQYIGELDWFGGLGSDYDLPHTKIPNAWHHLNAQLPLSMNLSQVLKQALPVPSSTSML